MDIRIKDELFAVVTAAQLDFNTRLDAECKRVLGLYFPNGWSPGDVVKQNFAIVYTPDGAARICKDGKPVSNIISPAKFIEP